MLQTKHDPLSLHKTQFDPVATPTEAVDFCHRPAQNRTPSLFTLNETAPAARMGGLAVLWGVVSFPSVGFLPDLKGRGIRLDRR